eukprot:Clim_evm20s158 gene=Clim_evmTU20s158
MNLLRFVQYKKILRDLNSMSQIAIENTPLVQKEVIDPLESAKESVTTPHGTSDDIASVESGDHSSTYQPEEKNSSRASDETKIDQKEDEELKAGWTDEEDKTTTNKMIAKSEDKETRPDSYKTSKVETVRHQICTKSVVLDAAVEDINDMKRGQESDDAPFNKRKAAGLAEGLPSIKAMKTN